MVLKNIVKILIPVIAGVGIGVYLKSFCDKGRLKQLEKDVEKYFEYYQLMLRWVELGAENKKIEDFFLEENIQNIAVYGMGVLGNLLTASLIKSKVRIAYGIDKNNLIPDARISDIYSINDNLPKVDAVVVTPFHDFEAIREDIEAKCDYRVISIRKIVYSL